VLLAGLPEDWRLFELLAHTGLRFSEAAGLTWEHVDLGTRPRLRVVEQVYRGERKRLKCSHARRDVPLSARMARRLAERRRYAYEGEKAPVFPSERGTPLHRSNVVRRVLNPAKATVGLEWVTPHTFRHTCVSLLFDGGKNVKQVQEWLGHANPSFTLNTYVHLVDEGLGGADFLDEAIGAPTEEVMPQER
jgi:integrase